MESPLPLDIGGLRSLSLVIMLMGAVMIMMLLLVITGPCPAGKDASQDEEQKRCRVKSHREMHKERVPVRQYLEHDVALLLKECGLSAGTPY